MFPILKNRKHLITKGYSFPLVRNFLTVWECQNNVFQADRGVFVHFPIQEFTLNSPVSAQIKLKSPAGNVSTYGMSVVDQHTLSYFGDLMIKGTWLYQISLNFSGGTLYHLEVGRFWVRSNIN